MHLKFPKFKFFYKLFTDIKVNIIKIIIMIISILPAIKTPISIGIILIFNTIIITILINKIIITSWLAIITFLIIIGGLLILFIYIRRLASNEKFKINIKIIILLLIIFAFIDEFLQERQINETQNIIRIEITEHLSIGKLYNKKSISITLIIVMYLLLTIIVVTKIVKHYEGPLRSKN